jgi:hypothetical protein
MTITVDITPEVKAELTGKAAARGRALEAHAASLLEGCPPHAGSVINSERQGAQNLVEVCAMLEGLTDEA